MPQGTEDQPVRMDEICEWFTDDVAGIGGSRARKVHDACMQ